MLSPGEYLAGAAWAAAAWGAVAAAAVLLVRRRLAHLRGAERAVALGLLVMSGLILTHLVPGALGLLGRPAVLAASLLVLTAAAVVRTVPPGDPALEPAPAAAPAGRAAWALAALSGGWIAAAATGVLVARAGLPPVSTDTLTIHAPTVARWLQTGSMWGLHSFVPDLSHATYPHHGAVLQLAAVLPWESLGALRLAAPPAWALAALGAYALGRALGAPAPAAVTAAAAFAAVPVVALPAFDAAQVDAPLLAGFAAGLLFLVRHARTGRTSDLVLAGVGLGVALGTKWYGVTSVGVVVGLWALARAAAGRGPLPAARDAGRLGAVVVATGGFWLLRNLVETGNPLFPVRVALGDAVLFDAPPDVVRAQAGATLLDHATDLDAWRERLLPALAPALGWPAATLAAAAALAVALAARRPRHPLVGLGGAAGLALALAYAATPYTAGPPNAPVLAYANSRYGMPALLLAAPLAAWAAGRLGRAGLALLALLALSALAGARPSFGGPPASALADGALVLGALAAALALARRARRAGTAALAVALAGAALLGGERLRERANASGYAAADPTLAFIEAHAPAGWRVGLAGAWSVDGIPPILPAFGPRFENRVEYVGPFVRHMLRDHERRDDFVAALSRGRFDLLLLGRGDPPGSVPPQERWARASGWRPVVRSRRLVLLVRPAPTARRTAAGT